MRENSILWRTGRSTLRLAPTVLFDNGNEQGARGNAVRGDVWLCLDKSRQTGHNLRANPTRKPLSSSHLDDFPSPLPNGVFFCLKQSGLEPHPEETKVVYGEDANRREICLNEKLHSMAFILRLSTQ